MDYIDCCVDAVSSLYPSFPGRMAVWATTFTTWYILFTAVHVPFIATYSTSTLVLIMTGWNILWFLTLVHLFEAYFASPRLLPSDYHWNKITTDESVINSPKKFSKALTQYVQHRPELGVEILDDEDDEGYSGPRICPYCRTLKPPRVHHCRSCDKCIIRKDHHCPVLASCIHLHNHKFFLNFLFWSTLLATYAVVVMTSDLYAIFCRAYNNPDKQQDIPELIPFMLSTCGYTNAVLFLQVCFFALLVFQAYLWRLLLRNQTIVEWHAETGEDYNLNGWLANVKSIYGEKWWLWLLPVPGVPDDYLGFRKSGYKEQ